MISIIIASVKKNLLSAITANIKETIGIDYEIISYDNTILKLGLCSIYNIGIEDAKYDLICFMHEDIEFKQKNWGEILVKIFEKHPNIGIVGVAGSKYKTLAPSGWGVGNNPYTEVYSYIQRFKNQTAAPQILNVNASRESLQKVISLDGMLMTTNRKAVTDFKFDENLFKGFHCYDIDYCLQVGNKYDIAVSTDILIEHFSEGGFNQEWVDETLKLHHKWSAQLPKSTIKIPHSITLNLEKRAYIKFIQILVSLKYPFSYIFKFIKIQKRKTKMNSLLFCKLIYYSIKFKIEQI